jgi:arylsulfatase
MAGAVGHARGGFRLAPNAVALVLALSALAGCGEERPNVLIVTVDSLRADHLGCYGYARDTSPAIDGLARQSMLFERAYAHAPFTAPAHASLLTGLEVPSHGVHWWDGQLAGESEPLFERLAAAHWRTGAFYNHPSLAPTGIERGFQHVEKRNWEPWPPTLAGFFAWIDASDSRFGAWIHLWDVHRPYGWRDYAEVERSFGVEIDWEPARFAYGEGEFGALPEPALGRGEEFYNLSAPERAARRFALGGAPRPLAARDYQALADRYDGGVRYADQAIGALVEGLGRRGLLEDTLLVLTADHGESLAERSACYFTHDPFLYDETLRVPLLLKLPGGAGGRRIDGLARHIDVLPTVLELVGLPPRGDDQGLSLVPEIHGRTPRARVLLAETRARQAKESDAKAPAGAWIEERAALFDGRFKLIEDSSAGTAALYDLASDPGEVRDLAGDPSGAVELERLRRELAELRRRLPVAGSSAAALDDEELRRLGHQGYLEIEADE